jgi:hypothetical protein
MGRAGPGPLIDAMGVVIGQERAARCKQIKGAIEEARRSFEAKLEALEERLVQDVKPRIIDHLEQCSRTHTRS